MSSIILSLDNVMFTSKQFNCLRELIWDARNDYRSLAFALGVTHDVVVSMEKNNQNDVERCFDAVLDEVLKKGVTQEDLAKALESKMVRRPLLAQGVHEATFTPGTESIYIFY